MSYITSNILKDLDKKMVPGYLQRTSILDFVGAAFSRDRFNSRLKAAPTGVFLNLSDKRKMVFVGGTPPSGKNHPPIFKRNQRLMIFSFKCGKKTRQKGKTSPNGILGFKRIRG